MKRKTKQLLIALFITGVIPFFYTVYLTLFADVLIMTEGQYARAAQEIVNGSLPSSPCAAKTTLGCYPQ